MARVLRSIGRCLKRYQTPLKWAVALGLLAYLFHENIYENREALGRIADRGIAWLWAAAAVVLCTGSILLTFVRWYLLLWAQEFDLRLRDVFRLSFIGFLLNYAAPGQVGGDLFKAALIAREQGSRRLVAVATVVLDRGLGLLGLVMVGAAAAWLLMPALDHSTLQVITAIFWAGSLAGVAGLVLFLHPATPRWKWVRRMARLPYVGPSIGEMITAVVLYQTRRRVVVLVVGISVVAHFGMLSSFYMCARALRLQEAAPSYAAHLVVVPAAEVGASFVPLPGGVGVLEGAVSYFYGVLEERPDQKALARTGGFLAALLFRLIMLVVAAVGFAYYMTARREVDRAVGEITPETEHELAHPGSLESREDEGT